MMKVIVTKVPDKYAVLLSIGEYGPMYVDPDSAAELVHKIMAEFGWQLLSTQKGD